jgi:serine phosphatase RsbU (regulator of sigma subunit)
VFTRELRPHEVFLLFTDGIVEATNAADEEFGRDRLTEVMRDHLDQDLPSLLQAILTALARFSEGQVLPDDVCLVGVEAIADRSHAADERVLDSGRQLHAEEVAR